MFPSGTSGRGLEETAPWVRKLLDETPAWHRFDIVNDIIGGDVATVSFVAERFVDDQASTTTLSNLEWTLTSSMFFCLLAAKTSAPFIYSNNNHVGHGELSF